MCATLNIYEVDKDGNSIWVMWVCCWYSENSKLCTACIFHTEMCHYILIVFLITFIKSLNRKRKKEVRFLSQARKFHPVFGVIYCCNGICLLGYSSNKNLSIFWCFSVTQTTKYILIWQNLETLKLFSDSSVCHDLNSDLEIRQNDCNFDFNRFPFQME